MKTTIDRAGRVVIPAAIRARLGLRAGTPIEVTVDDLSIRLFRSVPGPKLVRKNGRLVARPTVPDNKRPAIDIGALIDDERNRWPW